MYNWDLSWQHHLLIQSINQFQFWSGLIPVNGVGQTTLLWKQSLQFPLSIYISLDSMHPPSSNQHSCSPSPLAYSMSSSVVLASSFPSLQTPMLFLKHTYHSSLTHALTISLCSLLPSEPLIKLLYCYLLVIQQDVAVG